MVRFFRCHILQSSRRVHAVILAFVLLSGFAFGILSSGSAEQSLFQLMRTAASARVSIICLLPVIFLPVLFSALAVYIGQRWLIFLLAFAKAFLIGYLSSSILIRYPDSGFLFVLLFLCSDCLTFPVMCWFWLRILSGEKSAPCIYAVILWILWIGILDSQVISPFLATLLS